MNNEKIHDKKTEKLIKKYNKIKNYNLYLPAVLSALGVVGGLSLTLFNPIGRLFLLGSLIYGGVSLYRGAKYSKIIEEVENMNISDVNKDKIEKSKNKSKSKNLFKISLYGRLGLYRRVKYSKTNEQKKLNKKTENLLKKYNKIKSNYKGYKKYLPFIIILTGIAVGMGLMIFNIPFGQYIIWMDIIYTVITLYQTSKNLDVINKVEKLDKINTINKEEKTNDKIKSKKLSKNNSKENNNKTFDISNKPLFAFTKSNKNNTNDEIKYLKELKNRIINGEYRLNKNEIIQDNINMQEICEFYGWNNTNPSCNGKTKVKKQQYNKAA